MIRTHVGGLWSKTRATYRRRIRSVSGDMGGESSRRTVATNVGVGIVVALLLVAGPIGGMVAGAPISSMDTGASDGPQGFFEVTIESTNAPVAAGETLTVTAEVVNLFDADDTKEISLTVDGIERDSRELTLHGGERETVTLEWQTDAGDAGDYEAVVSSEDDSDAVSVTVEGPPEPAQFSVTILEATSPVEPGDLILVDVEVTNVGDVTAEQAIDLFVDGVSLGDPVELSLAGGESQTLTWETTLDEAGTYAFEVTSADDTDSTTVVVDAPPVGPQLEVTVLESSYDPADDRYTTLVEVTNTGDEAGTVEVELLVDGQSLPEPVVGAPDEPVEPGESTEIELTWSNPDLDAGTYQLTILAGDVSVTSEVTIEPSDEDVAPADDGVSMLMLGLLIGGVLVVAGAFLYHRRRGTSTHPPADPGADGTVASTVADPGVVASTVDDRGAPASDETERESRGSVPVPPPAGDDDCEDEREAFAAMLADLEAAMADAAAADAAAAAAAERASEAAEESKEAEERYDRARGDLDSAEDARDELQAKVDEAREAASEAQAAREEREREHRIVRDRVTSLQRQLRQMDEEGASQYFKAPLRKQIHELKQERRDLSHAHRESIDAANEAEEALRDLEDQLEEAEEALESAQESYDQADAEADAKHDAATDAEAEAEAAADAAEAAAEAAEAMLDATKAAAAEYGECVEGYLDELEEQAREARERGEQSADWAEKEREVAEGHAESGDSAAEDAFPEGDPAGAAGEHYGDGKTSRDAVEGEAEHAENSADEAGRTHEEAERMRDLLEEFTEGLRERGLPGADDLPSGEETAERTGEDAERAREAAEKARESAVGASELFSQCEDGETKPTDEVYYERHWRPHPTEPVEVDFTPRAYDGASDHADRGQAVKRAIEGMSTLFRRLNQVLSGDVAEMLTEAALDLFEGDVDETTQAELERYVEALLEGSDVDTEIGGKAGIPAAYYAALFSAAEELLGGAETLRELVRERDLGELEIRITMLYTERRYDVVLVCRDGRWVREVGALSDEQPEPWTETRVRTRNVRENQIPETVADFVERNRQAGARGQSGTR